MISANAAGGISYHSSHVRLPTMLCSPPHSAFFSTHNTCSPTHNATLSYPQCHAVLPIIVSLLPIIPAPLPTVLPLLPIMPCSLPTSLAKPTVWLVLGHPCSAVVVLIDIITIKMANRTVQMFRLPESPIRMVYKKNVNTLHKWLFLVWGYLKITYSLR